MAERVKIRQRKKTDENYVSGEKVWVHATYFGDLKVTKYFSLLFLLFYSCYFTFCS